MTDTTDTDDGGGAGTRRDGGLSRARPGAVSFPETK
jgi:hypothetical protein